MSTARHPVTTWWHNRTNQREVICSATTGTTRNFVELLAQDVDATPCCSHQGKAAGARIPVAVATCCCCCDQMSADCTLR